MPGAESAIASRRLCRRDIAPAGCIDLDGSHQPKTPAKSVVETLEIRGCGAASSESTGPAEPVSLRC